MNFSHLLSLLPIFLGMTAQPAVPVASPAPLHGIYLTSSMVADKKGDEILDKFAKAGGNMIVFDIQGSGGKLAYPSALQTSVEIDNRGGQIADLPALVKKLHDKGFYAVARFTLLKNWFLAKKKPQWVLKKRGTNRAFTSRDGPIWLDPTNPELSDYFIEIVRELALNGVDEVQFDYARFPEGGKGGYIGYSFQDDGFLTREQAITNFVSQLAAELHFFHTKASVDVFGIVVWDNISGRIIGQNIGELAKNVDAIYPMPYPSHFGPGWGGHRNPADEPYFFVQETTKKFIEQTGGAVSKIRPWLQGFAMGTRRFNANYIRDQIRALMDIGIGDFSVWNASNSYTYTFQALAP